VAQYFYGPNVHSLTNQHCQSTEASKKWPGFIVCSSTTGQLKERELLSLYWLSYAITKNMAMSIKQKSDNARKST